MPFDPVAYREPPRGDCGARDTTTRARVPAPARSLASAVVGLIRRSVAIRQLRRLDDRLLRDIGVERGEIADTVDAMLAIAPRS